MPPCNKKEKNHLKNVQNYMLYVMRKEIQKATHTFLAALLFFGMPRNKKGKNVQDYIKHENRKLWGKPHLSSEYNQPLCLALLWNTERKKRKMSKITCCYMRNEIAKPTFISLVALLSFGILRKKNENQLKKRNIWNIHHIKKMFWQIYCLLCPAGWMVKKKKVKMIWLSSQPQLTNNPT